jgi:predicted transcriptional regulator
MLTKEKLLASINAMPEEKFDDIDVLLERIVFLDKIERGEKDIEEGNVISHEEVGNIIQSWFKK